MGTDRSPKVKLKPDMLRSAKSLHDYHVQATDGNVGRVKDFLCDSREWVVRYAVVETSEWHRGRTVLLIPDILGVPSTEGQILPVELTRDQIKNSPDINVNQPVSRPQEAALFAYYGCSPYWSTGPDDRTTRGESTEQGAATATGNPNLTSMRGATGYSIRATDGDMGHLEDFILEDESWRVRYIVVHTGHRLGGRRVIISPQWVEALDRATRTFRLSLSAEEVKDSPPYDPNLPVNRQYEVHLYDYYGRLKYW